MRATFITARSILIGLILISDLRSRSAESPSSAPERDAILLTESGQLKINQHEPISLGEIKSSAQPFSQDGVTVAPENGQFSIHAQKAAEIAYASAPGFRAFLPAKNELSFEVNASSQALGLATPESNNSPIRLAFPDRGEARVGPKSFARYESFLDKTYSFAGRGDVKSISADGLEVKGSPLSAPLVGGELEPVKNGQSRLARKTPVTRVTVFKDGSDLAISVNDQKPSLAKSDPQKVELPNGTHFSLKVDSAKNTLGFGIEKGICQFSVDGFPNWSAVGVSGQSASITWNPDVKQIDIRNKTVSPGPINGEILVNLSSRITASVAPGAIFQYSPLRDPGSFVTGAAGGQVNIFNADTGETTAVQKQNVLFSRGFSSASIASGFERVTLNWDDDKNIQLRGTQGVISVGFGRSETLRIADDILDASYGADGVLKLRAMRGDFDLRPEFLNDLSFQVPQGGALLLDMNRSQNLFKARLAPGSIGEVRARAGGALSEPFIPEKTLTVVIRKGGYFAPGSRNDLTWIYFEGAGGQKEIFKAAAGGGGSNPFQPERVPTDASRIPQDPVSVIE
jgi:hypothetical protein